jgi:methylthioribose-1-phosphate isomerase
MRINGKPYHTIWLSEKNPSIVQVIDQRKLPFVFEILDLKTPDDCFFAIRDMAVRGAPLIGVTAAYGMYLALLCFEGENPENYLHETATRLKLARPTAVNLAYAVDEMLKFMLGNLRNSNLKEISLTKVEELKSREIGFSEKIGEFGLKIIEKIYQQKEKTGKYFNPLQCRLAGLHRLGNSNGSHLQSPSQRNSGACVGG